jgi:Holliday junction DNA helicase RuvA
MIYSLTGELKRKGGRVVVIGVGGVDFKVAIPIRSEAQLPKIGEKASLFTYLHVRENSLELYGFLTEKEIGLFELLLSVSGIGPKSALSILSVAPVDQLMAAISQGETELLQGSSGVGRKTAERIVVELKDKIIVAGDKTTIEIMQKDSDILEALMGLGYTRSRAKEAIEKIDASLTSASERLRDALNKIKK